jgi:hypothetical protein
LNITSYNFGPIKIIGGILMTEKKNEGLLKTVLVIYIVVVLIYGILYLFVPDFLVKLSGGAPVFHGWLRWSGGVLIALGAGTVLVYINPKNQGIFVTTIALGCLLAGLALVWTWINIEEGAHLWFTALPAIITLALSVLLWWARKQAKDILYPKQG